MRHVVTHTLYEILGYIFTIQIFHIIAYNYYDIFSKIGYIPTLNL